MGEAKRRGSKEDRVEEARLNRGGPPKVGLYRSKRDTNFLVKVESVFVPDASEIASGEFDEGYFLVAIVSADDADDMQAMGYELDNVEWDELVRENEFELVVMTN